MAAPNHCDYLETGAGARWWKPTVMSRSDNGRVTSRPTTTKAPTRFKATVMRRINRSDGAFRRARSQAAPIADNGGKS